MEEPKKPENPLVYPSKEMLGDELIYQSFGIKFRDRLAEKAMLGLLSSGMYEPKTTNHTMNLAAHAYSIADSMLQVREKTDY